MEEQVAPEPPPPCMARPGSPAPPSGCAEPAHLAVVWNLLASRSCADPGWPGLCPFLGLWMGWALEQSCSRGAVGGVPSGASAAGARPSRGRPRPGPAPAEQVAR